MSNTRTILNLYSKYLGANKPSLLYQLYYLAPVADWSEGGFMLMQYPEPQGAISISPMKEFIGFSSEQVSAAISVTNPIGI